MKNKFLKQYPQFWKPKMGDKIRIIKLLDGNKNQVDKWHYCIGDIGVIEDSIETSKGDGYIIKFNFNKLNTFTVYKEELELM